MTKSVWLPLAAATVLLAGCAVTPTMTLSTVSSQALRSTAAAWPTLTGARPMVLPGQRALAQRIKPDEPKTPYELWESRLSSRWQAPVKLFPDLPSAYDAQMMAAGQTTRLYFAAIPPRSYTPRIHQTTAAKNGPWQEPEKLDLLDQGKGAESPDVVTDRSGRWWLAYASAGRITDVRLAKSDDGLHWDFVDKLADGAVRPKLAALSDGRLAIAYELNGSVIVRVSRDGTTWQDSLTLPGSREAAMLSLGNRLLLATLPAARRSTGITWRQSSDGRQWSAPQTAPAPAGIGSLRWLSEDTQVTLYGAAADGQGATVRIPVGL
jgi:hypothetical protein